MKINKALATLFLAVFSGIYFELTAQVTAACNNEDFEAGPAGPVTNSTGIQGWTIFKINNPQFGPALNNCTALSSTNAVRSNPTAVQIFTTNALIDTILGVAYPVHSVFGGTVSNGGEATNPELSFMSGNSFLRLGDASSIPYNNQAIEKTFLVTSSNCLFRLAVLPIIHSGSSCCDAPAIKIQFFNASSGNTLIPCPSYSLNVNGVVCANPYSSDLVLSPNPNTSGTYYRKWRVIAVDLTPYIGSTIGCRVGAFYCATGCAKYAYCYLDAQCGPMEIKVNGTILPAITNSVNFVGCGVTQATITTPPQFSTYQWNGPGNFSSTLSTIVTLTAGVYTLNIVPVGTCSTITKYINVSLLPAPSVTISSNKSVICKGESVKIIASGLSTYSWNVPGVTGTINVNPGATFTYNVNGLDANGCLGSATITQSVSTCQGIQNANYKEGGISIFPNPSYGEFTVQTIAEIGASEIEVINSLGEIVHTSQVTERLTKIKLNSPNSGLYFIQIKSQSGAVYSSRLVIP